MDYNVIVDMIQINGFIYHKYTYYTDNLFFNIYSILLSFNENVSNLQDTLLGPNIRYNRNKLILLILEVVLIKFIIWRNFYI